MSLPATRRLSADPTLGTDLKVAIVTIGDPNRITGGYLYLRRMADAATRHGCEAFFASLPDLPFPFPALHAQGLWRSVLASMPDIVVIDSLAACYLAGVVRKKGNPPIIASIHQPPGGIDSGRLRRHLQSPLDWAMYGRCRYLIAASEPLAAMLMDHTQDSTRIVVVPPGRDLPAPNSMAIVDLRDGRKISLLCVASWLPNKGILYLLEALATVPDKTASLHLVGDNAHDRGYSRRVWRRLNQPDLKSRVIVHGALSLPEVAAMYRGADVFTLASFNEAFATVVGEAMAYGLPVIAWRVGNIPVLVSDAEGVLLDPGDVAGMAGAIQTLASDSDLREQMGDAAKARAASRPTWEESEGEFHRVLREAVGGG